MQDTLPGEAQNCSGPARHDVVKVDYRNLFMLISGPILVLGPDGQLLAVNLAACNLLGLDTRDSGPLQTLWELPGFSCHTDSSANEMLSRLIDDTQDSRIARWEFVIPETDRVMEAQLSSIPDDVLKGGGFLWTAHDVTERVHLEQTRQQLVHMLVHDLRVPLGNIQNSLDLVLTAWHEHDVTLPMEQVLQIGIRSAQRMERLINDILDTARLQAHEHTLTVSAIDVASLVEEAVDIVAAHVERHEQILHIQIMPDLPPMEGDLALLRRVLINLLNNASKFTQDGGEITVRAELVSADNTPDKFQFTVIDNGRGIAPEVQSHLFELFYRGDTSQIKGAGIGLAFCKLAVEAHGGSIWVESMPGVGSTFTFTIPERLPEDAPYYQEIE